MRRRPTFTLALALALTGATAAAAAGCSDDVREAGSALTATTTTAPSTTQSTLVIGPGDPRPHASLPPADADGDGTPDTTTTTTTTADPENETRDSAGATEVRVSRVIDGDTLELENGDTVRLIGIDTPERGDCGFDAAALVLADLIDDRPVLLTDGARDDRDRYGRSLRYVTTHAGLDAGLELILDGRAVARYDSRDGYGTHPHEERYTAADAATAHACTG